MVIRAQSQPRKLVWASVSETHNMSKNYFIQMDATVRSDHEAKHVQTIFLRPGLGYRINKTTSIGLGFNYSLSRMAINEMVAYKAEKQVWQQQLFRWTNGRFQLLERLLAEQRFIPVIMAENNSIVVKNYDFSLRSRFFTKVFWQLVASMPANKGNYAYAQQEIFVNLSGLKAVNTHNFDQIRAAIGLGHHFKKMDSEIGIMYRNLLNRNGTHYNDLIFQVNHFLRF